MVGSSEDELKEEVKVERGSLKGPGRAGERSEGSRETGSKERDFRKMSPVTDVGERVIIDGIAPKRNLGNRETAHGGWISSRPSRRKGE